MKKRLNIALCIGMMDAEISLDFCEGALNAAGKTDANLFVLPLGILNEKLRTNDEEWFRYNYHRYYQDRHYTEPHMV